MTPERLAEITKLANMGEQVGAYRPLFPSGTVRELLAEIATLKGEVERLSQPDPVRFATCLYCGDRFPYMVGVQDEFNEAYKRMIAHDAICPKSPIVSELATLRSRLDALVTAAEKATQYALKEWGSQAYNPYTNKLETTSYNYVVDGRAIDALSAAVEQAKREGKE